MTLWVMSWKDQFHNRYEFFVLKKSLRGLAEQIIFSFCEMTATPTFNYSCFTLKSFKTPANKSNERCRSCHQVFRVYPKLWLFPSWQTCYLIDYSGLVVLHLLPMTSRWINTVTHTCCIVSRGVNLKQLAGVIAKMYVTCMYGNQYLYTGSF